ncbi:hypothetical protein VCRA2110O318_100127 [Vibrio crassostreae]|nr:hypothetical protein VCRA2117O328_110074 [Vibrio crassostreae]CAK2232575.1 hypothetical protein VCRA2110O318_100127 [Vibrio crassostreae]CAK2395101.1 hypothetical protein VCRA2110O319_100125 [Vibrio crassostreae]CAK2570925.1 hypothetical protein VCRA217O317_100078 [Vibrio crassostreae]
MQPNVSRWTFSWGFKVEPFVVESDFVIPEIKSLPINRHILPTGSNTSRPILRLMSNRLSLFVFFGLV